MADDEEQLVDYDSADENDSKTDGKEIKKCVLFIENNCIRN